MASDVETLLESDHRELDGLLADVFAELDSADCARVYRALDYFWARLAMHIRAEHLRLFPAVVRLSESTDSKVPDLIRQLHEDHDFFMRQLARAIKAMRLIFDWGNETETLVVVRDLVTQVRDQLVEHNRIEEDSIYPIAAASASRLPRP